MILVGLYPIYYAILIFHPLYDIWIYNAKNLPPAPSFAYGGI